MKVLRIDLGSDMMDIDVTPIKVVRDLVEALKRVPNLTFDQTLEMQVHDTAQTFLENKKIVTLTWSNKPVSDPKPEDHDDHTGQYDGDITSFKQWKLHAVTLTSDPGAPGYIESVRPVEQADPELEALLEEEKEQAKHRHPTARPWLHNFLPTDYED
jgi:hypothetical protein